MLPQLLPQLAQSLRLAGNAGALVDPLEDLLSAVRQCLLQQGTERAALPLGDHPHRLLMGNGVLIAALADKGVIHIRHCHHLRGNRDLLAHQPIGIARTVIALVVPAADGVRRLDQRLLPEGRQLRQHIRPLHRMGLYDPELLRRQPSRLVQDLLVNGDLTDVMQGGGGGDNGDLLLRQAVAPGQLGDAPQQKLRHDADMHHMQPALAVAELHDMPQNVHHQVGVALLFIHLIRGDLQKPPLPGVHPQQGRHPPPDPVRLKGTADVVHHTQVICPLPLPGAVLLINENHGNVVAKALVLHHFQHAEAVYLRHDGVQQHQIDDRNAPAQQGDGFNAVLRLQHLALILQKLPQKAPLRLGIIHNQYTLCSHNKHSYPPVREGRTFIRELSFPQYYPSILLSFPPVFNRKTQDSVNSGKVL